MKPLFLLMTSTLLLAGCSEQSGEQTGKEIAAQLQSPIQKTSAISEKVRAIREAEIPK